jgi:hypothetical protein
MGSYYGNSQMDDLRYAIDDFLENNTITELLTIVNDAVEYKEDEYREKIEKANND